MCDTTGVTSISLRNPDLSPIGKEESHNSHQSNHLHHHHHHHPTSKTSKHASNNNNNNNNNNNELVQQSSKQNQVGTVMLFGVPIVSLVMDGKERLCLAQISSTLLKDFSYNEIHNRRVALGITCVQCTPVQLEILRRAGAMPVTSRRCGMITRREAERLCQSFLGDHAPPQLPENFAFEVYHECGWGSRGSFVPSRYNSSRAKCIRCTYCQLFFSPNKFIFHSHRLPESRYVQPDAANFNSWRRHLKLCGDPPDEVTMYWEDVRAMFNGGTRKRMLAAHSSHHTHHQSRHSDNHRRLSNLAHGIKNASNPPANSNGNGPSLRNSGGTPHPQRSNANHHPQNGNNVPSQNNPINNNGSNNGQLLGTSFGSSDNPQSIPIPNTSPNNFLTVPSPLISPSARLDTIWNPGLTSVSGNGMNLNMNLSGSNASRQCVGGLGGTAPLPHLPFHPLSIPWLRRPLFPFPHPFAPAACHLLTDPSGLGSPNVSIPEKIGRQATSAFKPVSRSAEHLFTWLNSGNNPGGLVCPTLPEDLSLNSLSHGHISSPNLLKPLENGNSLGLVTTSPSIERGPQGHSSVSSTNDDDNDISPDYPRKRTTGSSRFKGNHNNNNNNGNLKHQIQMMSSSMENETDDEETVDIESTEVEEECSSTSTHIWVNSQKRKRSESPSESDRESCSGHSGGEDETVPYPTVGSKGEAEKGSCKSKGISTEDGHLKKGTNSKRPKNSDKTKRLWDFGTSPTNKESGKKGSGSINEMSPTSPKSLLESKD